MQPIKINSHGNQLEVYKSTKRHYKSAMTMKANHTIDIEKQGYDWFGVETEPKKNGLSILAIPTFEGKTFPQYNGITGNEKWIKKLIEFYKTKWGGESFCIHGDLCLCNVIFNDTVKVVDWEHFHKASKEYFGFDIINMLFIQLQYEYRWWSYWGFNWVPFIKQKHKDFIKECVKMLGDTGFLRQPFTRSSWYVNKYMDKKKFLLGRLRQETLESLDIICL